MNRKFIHMHHAVHDKNKTIYSQLNQTEMTKSHLPLQLTNVWHQQTIAKKPIFSSIYFCNFFPINQGQGLIFQIVAPTCSSPLPFLTLISQPQGPSPIGDSCIGTSNCTSTTQAILIHLPLQPHPLPYNLGSTLNILNMQLWHLLSLTCWVDRLDISFISSQH